MCVGDFVDCCCPNVDKCAKCKENCVPPSKRKRLRGKESSSSADKENDIRFQFLTTGELEALREGYKVPNTEKNTQWSMRNFEAWKKARTDAKLEACPDDLLCSTDPAVLSEWLSLFAAETRNAKGKPYAPTSIYQLLSGLLRHMRTANPEALNFLDKRDKRFAALHNSLDSIFRRLRTENVGTIVKHAEVFTREEEQALWEKGTLGTTSPKSLLNAVFFLNGKNFCLRGGEEHRRLALSQVVRHYNPDHYIYTENGSKNRKGTFTERHIANKVVPIYATKAGERCHVHILDTYFSKLPRDATEQDVFYLRPLSAVPKDPTQPWFQSTPIGKNELGKMVQNMCLDAGIQGNKTNHSLRATGASTLFHANIPEKIIQERTGHRSLVALRQYERTTDEQQVAVSEILAGNEHCGLDQEPFTPQPQPFMPQLQPQPFMPRPQPQPFMPRPQPQPQPFMPRPQPQPFMPQLQPICQPQQSVFNMQGCTVNISMVQQPAPLPPPHSVASSTSDITAQDMIDFLNDL